MQVTVAVAQYAVPLETKDSIAKLEQVTKDAAGKGVQLLVAPETAIGMLGEVKTTAGNYLPDLQRIASNVRITLATSFYTRINDQYFNQGYIVDSEDHVILSHKKIYLAPPERDQGNISEGNSLEVADTALGKVGMLICKDGFNRYSHFLYDRLNQLQAEIICIPTWSITWPEMDTQEYIKALFAYGAFQSRAFVLVSGNTNQGSFGRSLIISPINGVLVEASSDQEELLVHTIDLEETKTAREFDSFWQPQQIINPKS